MPCVPMIQSHKSINLSSQEPEQPEASKPPRLPKEGNGLKAWTGGLETAHFTDGKWNSVVTWLDVVWFVSIVHYIIILGIWGTILTRPVVGIQHLFMNQDHWDDRMGYVFFSWCH